MHSFGMHSHVSTAFRVGRVGVLGRERFTWAEHGLEHGNVRRRHAPRQRPLSPSIRENEDVSRVDVRFGYVRLHVVPVAQRREDGRYRGDETRDARVIAVRPLDVERLDRRQHQCILAATQATDGCASVNDVDDALGAELRATRGACFFILLRLRVDPRPRAMRVDLVAACGRHVRRGWVDGGQATPARRESFAAARVLLAHERLVARGVALAFP